MASRTVWKGFIQFSLVSVPVRAYTATVTGGGEVRLNQLHNECHSRIQYKKMCPVHGEIPNDQIVSGYEFSKGQYVVVDPEEIEKLKSERDKSINIGAFIPPDAIDPKYYSGKTYYLVPDGPAAFKPYSLLHRAMTETDRNAFAQVSMYGREQLVLVRPVENMFAMTFLAHAQDFKPIDEFKGEAPKVEVSPEEIKLAKTLTDALSQDEFDLAQYKDNYTDNLTKLIEAKVKGEEIVAPTADEQPRVINLMEALQKSLAVAKKATGKPPKLVAPPTRGAAKDARKRKTS